VCEGDKIAEKQVDECLLIPFRHCLRWNVDEHSSSSGKDHQQQYQVASTDVTQVGSAENGRPVKWRTKQKLWW